MRLLTTLSNPNQLTSTLAFLDKTNVLKRLQVCRQLNQKLTSWPGHVRGPPNRTQSVILAESQVQHSIALATCMIKLNVSLIFCLFSHPFFTETFGNFQSFFRSDLLLRFVHVQITIEIMSCSELINCLYSHLKAPQIPFSAFKLPNPQSESSIQTNTVFQKWPRRYAVLFLTHFSCCSILFIKKSIFREVVTPLQSSCLLSENSQYNIPSINCSKKRVIKLPSKS